MTPLPGAVATRGRQQRRIGGSECATEEGIRGWISIGQLGAGQVF